MQCVKCNAELPEGSKFCHLCGWQQSKKYSKKSRQPNGMGWVFKKRGTSWAGRVYDSSSETYDPKTLKIRRKPVEKSGFASQKEARAWCIQWYLTHDRSLLPQKAPDLAHYWKLYSENEMEKLSTSKQTAYKIAWKRLENINAKPVDALTVADLRGVVAEKSTSYYTARDMKVLLSHLFELAAADRFADKDLPSFIVLPKLEETEKEIFTQEEQEKLWAAFDAGDSFAAWPLMMIYTGMMPGETMQLTIEMIDMENRTITGAGMKTKTRKAAVIHFPEILLPIFETLIGERTEGKLLRHNKDVLYKLYHELTSRIGIRDLEPYCCRHTMATAMALDKNVAPETLRKIMRWSKNSQMVSRYVHPDDTDIREAIEQSRPENTNN